MILAVLDEAGRPLTVTDLAERLVGRGVTSPEEAGVERVKVSLHHDSLPKLAEVGLVDYDPDENVVSDEGGLSGDVEWRELASLDELFACVERGTDVGDGSVGLIEGRENVVTYGRRLADEADDELFCMYAAAELLEERCVRCAETALERGVTVSLGSTDPTLRSLAHERLPGATVWEPQVDWMNDPTRYPTVGRLVVTDREQVMLALLQEPNVGDPAETAIVGESETNPLVVLVRDLLGARLDHLDYQSDDFLDALPFEP